MRKRDEIEKYLDLLFENYIKEMDIPGFAIGVVLEGKVEYIKGFGVENYKNGKQIAFNSLFNVGSITKTFVAIAIMQLHERGIIDITRPIVDYLPYFRLKDERYKDITVIQMLNHSSGMPDDYDDDWSHAEYSSDSLENHVKTFEKYDLYFDPGVKYKYSNIAYEALGDMISKVSNMSFEEYMKENILKPIGMNDSSFIITELPKDKLTSPHTLEISENIKVKANEVHPYSRIHASSSALYSSVEELCKYARVQLGKGKLKDTNLLKPESYDMMWSVHVDKGHDREYVGLGWFLKKYKGIDLVCHSGSNTGYASDLILIPEKSAAIVILNNCDYGNLDICTDTILDIVLGFDIQPLKISAAYSLAKVLISENYEAALEKLKEIEKFSDDFAINEDTFDEMAYAIFCSGNVDKSIDLLKLGVILLPQSSRLYSFLGEIYEEKGEKEKSIENYSKALELNPNNVTAEEAIKNLKKKI